MFLTMAKTTSINLRISPEFREEIETLAAYHGLSMSNATRLPNGDYLTVTLSPRKSVILIIVSSVGGNL